MAEDDRDRVALLQQHLFDQPKLDTIKGLPATPKLTPNIPQLSSSTSAAAATPGSRLVDSAKSITVQFVAPNAAPVSGQFAETDVDKLFNTLKAAGLRSSGTYL